MDFSLELGQLGSGKMKYSKFEQIVLIIEAIGFCIGLLMVVYPMENADLLIRIEGAILLVTSTATIGIFFVGPYLDYKETDEPMVKYGDDA